MTSSTDGTGGIPIALQASGVLSAKSNADFKSLQANAQQSNTEYNDSEAREVANKFEALLIHNMLKSMRKTTMSENTSNARAIYDDMLDEKLSDTMIKSGGLGIADQIVRQIREQQGSEPAPVQPKSDSQRLRELSKHIKRPTSSISDENVSVSDTANTYEVANVDTLKFAKGLWDNSTSSTSELSKNQKQFIASLTPHARRNAWRLGTSPDAILAIAALESGWGRSMITDANGENSHNLFGIKANASDNSYTTSLTTEYVNGSALKQHANFKTFDNDADAVDGFADFILENPRYSKALKHASNSERFLEELQIAGYATDPRYADKAISIMRQIARN